ncbi:MAG TPA: hypothetical protein VH188_03105 [Chthoniobacterales bacterium]|nr:hypothetical protein [Chthoniobacterales bacterium]
MPSKVESRSTSARYIVSAGGSSSGTFMPLEFPFVIIADAGSIGKLDVFMTNDKRANECDASTEFGR